MSFKRGFDRCAGDACNAQAALAFNVTVSTPGNRKTRVQKCSGTVRLCALDAKALAKGKVPSALMAELSKAIKFVTGEREVRK